MREALPSVRSDGTYVKTFNLEIKIVIIIWNSTIPDIRPGQVIVSFYKKGVKQADGHPDGKHLADYEHLQH